MSALAGPVWVALWGGPRDGRKEVVQYGQDIYLPDGLYEPCDTVPGRYVWRQRGRMPL